MLSQRKICILKNSSLSIVFLTLAYLIFITKPKEKIINHQVQLKQGTLLYHFWKAPPLPVLLKVYIFNITNADEFVKGIDKKLKLQEIGPYVYQEFLHHDNVTFNENGTVTYIPVRRTIPVPEMSIGDPQKDIVTIPNIPLIGLSTVANEISVIAALGMSTLAKSTNSKPILNLTVHDYLWGYEDNLVHLANKVLPNIFHFEKLGIMDRIFDEGQNVVTMNLPDSIERMKTEEKKSSELIKLEEESNEKLKHLSNEISHEELDVEYDEMYDDDYLYSSNEIESMSQVLEESKVDENSLELERRRNSVREYSIDTWNGSPGLPQWGYDNRDDKTKSRCNTIRGSYDGTLFPKNAMFGEEFKLYRQAFCRTLRIKAVNETSLYGINTLHFSLADDAFDDTMNDTGTSCFCNAKRNTCMRKGLGYIGSCYFTIPIAVSLPHFYNSDPTLIDEAEGIKPDKEKHETVVLIQPRLGVPINVRTRMQLNLVMSSTKFNKDIKVFDDKIVPLLWLELEMTKLTPAVFILVNLLFFGLPILEVLTTAIFILIGIRYFITFIVLSLPCSRFSTMKLSVQKGKLHTQRSIKYSAVFAYIGRESSHIFEDKERGLISNVDGISGKV